MKDNLADAPDAVALWNAVAAMMGQTLALDGRTRVSLAFAPPDLPDDALAVFELATLAGPVFAGLVRLPVGAMTQSTLDQAALGLLPSALSDAVVSLCLDRLVDAAGQDLRGKLRSVTRCEPARMAGEEWIGAEVEAGWGGTAQVLFAADRAVLTGFVSAFVPRGGGGPVPAAVAVHIALPVSLRLTGRALPLARLRQLQAGDILLTGGPGLWLAAPQAWFGLVRAGDGWTIGEVAMSDEFPAQTAADVAGDARQPVATDIGEVPVRLSFVLAERVLTLHEVQALSPGAVLPFAASPPDAGQPVQILANGRPVGDGHVIDLDGQPAVRIARLFGRE